MMDVRVQGFCPRHSDVPINYTGYYDGRISPSHSETLWSAVRLTFAAALRLTLGMRWCMRQVQCAAALLTDTD